MTPKIEYPPLLPVGLYNFRRDDLLIHCVDAFPHSTTRKEIFEKLCLILDDLENEKLTLDVWINGSFLTHKEHPDDSDILLRIPSPVYENGTSSQKLLIETISKNLKTSHRCDSYVLLIYPSGDARAAMNDWMTAYWMRQFGFSRGDKIKGIALYQIGGP